MTREKPDSLDCWSNENPVCPHCGEMFHLDKHDRAFDVSYEEGGQSEWTCDHCGEDFVSVTEIIYKYSTAIDADHASDEQWGHQEPAENQLVTEAT